MWIKYLGFVLFFLPASLWADDDIYLVQSRTQAKMSDAQKAIQHAVEAIIPGAVYRLEYKKRPEGFPPLFRLFIEEGDASNLVLKKLSEDRRFNIEPDGKAQPYRTQP